MNGFVSGCSRIALSGEADAFAAARLAVDFFLAGAFLVVVFLVAIHKVYTLVFKIGLNYNEINHG